MRQCSYSRPPQVRDNQFWILLLVEQCLFLNIWKKFGNCQLTNDFVGKIGVMIILNLSFHLPHQFKADA